MSGDARVVWSAITNGEQQEVFIRRRGATDTPWVVTLTRIAHFDQALHGDAYRITPKGVGDSAACQKDIMCVLDVLPPDKDAIVLAASRGVAYMVVTSASGSSGVCTGTLLNSVNFPRPYFISAAHCFSPDAVTLDTYWFRSREFCGSGAVSAAVQVTGGASVIWRDTLLDSAFLELAQSPPNGVSFTGWDATAISSPTTMLAIHHPRGDVKKASLGDIVGISSTPVTIPPTTFPAGTFYLVDWQVGIVEPGSSGSAFFTLNAAETALHVRGTLTGGATSCNTAIPSRPYYQRFDRIFPNISGPLTVPAVTPTPLTIQNGVWWSPVESGSGYAIAVSNGVLVMQIYSYRPDGEPQWYLTAGPLTNGNRNYVGTLDKYRGGQCISCPYRAPTPAGSDGAISIQFTTGTSAVVNLPGGRKTNIELFVF